MNVLFSKLVLSESLEFTLLDKTLVVPVANAQNIEKIMIIPPVN